jgi:hypothetical protein
MHRPNLLNIVDTVVPLRGASRKDYFRFLHNNLAPAIRALERDGKIIWYCFLIHNRQSAGRDDLPADFQEPFIHLRFGLPDAAPQRRFVDELSSPFRYPIATQLGPIGGVDEAAVNGDWPNAWWLIGEASDWVLKFAETNSADHFTDAHMIQFLHFVTNGLCIGGMSVFAGTRF